VSTRPDRPADITAEFGPARDSPRQARGAVQLVVAGRHDPIADAVRLVATELVANVVQHTATRRGTLRAWNERPGSPFRLEVEDEDPTLPRLKAEVSDEATARGLSLVAVMSDGWGVEPTARGGKIVWAEWDRSAPR
jgi:hypothetical protein